MKRKSKKDIVIIGFALFSMFFGAGNLIFPPFLGLHAGSLWLPGFIFYFLADVGLALVTFFTVLKHDSSESITAGLGKIPSTIILCLITLCIGPSVAIPRTAATTYEMAVKPLTDSISPVVFSIAFFLLLFILCIKQSAVVDIVGKFLTPGLLIGLAILIVKGVISPMGSVAEGAQLSDVIKNGIQSGYQTMDALGIVVFGAIIIKSTEQKGYTEKKEKTHMLIMSGAVACIGLLLTYLGLTYLGATASTMYPTDINHSTLLIDIVQNILGSTGTIIFSIVVALACITTALALVSSAADFFSTLFHGKISYKVMVAIICVVSAVLSNVGLDEIVKVASPILDVVYPPVLTVIIITLVCRKKPSVIILRAAVIGAFICSLLRAAHNMGLPVSFVTKLPLYSVGFGWVVPTIILGLIGTLINCIYKKEISLDEDLEI